MTGQQQHPSFKLPIAELTALDEPCPYLEGRVATFRGFFASEVLADCYRHLLDMAFRRSGRFFYFPDCRGCSECVPIRVPVGQFKPNRSQRRCWQRNQDLLVSVAFPSLDQEKFDLFCRYVRSTHSDPSEKDVGAVYDFLYNPVVPTLEFCYRNEQGKLMAVGICDLFDDGLSSVYCYYDPAEQRRGLGTFSVLKEIEHAREQSLAYYFLGYFVEGCQAMRYKATYRPNQLLNAERGWVGTWGEKGL